VKQCDSLINYYTKQFSNNTAWQMHISEDIRSENIGSIIALLKTLSKIFAKCNGRVFFWKLLHW